MAKLAKGKVMPLELPTVTRRGRSIQAPVCYRLKMIQDESEVENEAKTSAARQRPPKRKAAQHLALIEPDSECESDFEPESEAEAKTESDDSEPEEEGLYEENIVP